MDVGMAVLVMAGNFTSSDDTYARRFSALLKHSIPIPEHAPLELQESDIVWSFVSSDDSLPSPNSAYPSSNRHHDKLHFGSPQSGMPIAFNEDRHVRLSRSLSRKVPASARQEKIPLAFHQSAPVNIPLWPGKLRHNHGDNDLKSVDDAEDDYVEEEASEEMLPPHVIVARSHATFSVFEGVGRTLKGRDLCRVRNAVFQKTGFID